MSLAFNYRHLYYFWVVAKEGGIVRAARRLDMAVQTVSTQVRELERALGHALLKPAGRGLALTEAGIATMRQADLIFQLGGQLPAVVRDAVSTPTLRLVVGIANSVPKLVVRQLMQPAIESPNLRLLCREDDLEGLLAELALHRVDIVLADRAASSHPNLKLYSHELASSSVAWYGPAALKQQALRHFPASLAQVPVLLPSAHAAVRGPLDLWFERHAVRPNVVGEFDDSALLKAFGASGMGVFPAPEIVHDDLVSRYRVQRFGRCEGIDERFYAIGAEKKVSHPLVQAIVAHRLDPR